jgi:serine protease Do
VQPVNAVDAELYGLDRVAGAKVFNVAAGSPAALAGLRAGDVILTIDGSPVDNATELTTKLAQHRPADRITMGIVRAAKRLQLEATLGEFAREGERVAQRTDSPATASGKLGFRVEPVTRQLASRLGLDAADGVLIADVAPYSPAARAGVQNGLLLRSVNDTAITSVADLDRVAAGIDAGDIVSLRAIGGDLGEVVFNYRLR